MELRFKMSLVALSITGVLLAWITIILICLILGLLLVDFFQGMLLLISIALVIIFLEFSSFSSSSSAAPPACLDGFIVETNGGTGGAYTCTPLNP